MNKLIYLFAMILSLSLWSCGKDDDGVDDPNNPNNPGNPDNVTLELSTKDLVFEAQGGELTFDITCNADWTITNESDWCTLDMTSGKGNATVKVSTGVYEENEDRNTVLTVKAGNTPQTLTVTQKHEDALILSKDKFDVPQAGDNITIELRSNIECALTIPSRFQEWISESPSGKGMETKTFNLTIKENEAFETREGFVIISGNELKDTVHIFQAQKDQLILTQNTYNITSEKQDILVELKTNVDYDITIPDSVSSWISLLETKASRTDRLNLSIAANEETESRSALVLIKDKNSDLADTLYINQAQKDAFFFVQNEYNAKAAGETIVVELLHNLSPYSYQIYMSNKDSEWLNVIPMPSSKALTNEKMQIIVSPNESLKSRSGKIIFNSDETDLSDTITVYQAARSEMILAQKEFAVQGQGGNISVKLQSNIDFEVNIAENATTWITQIQTKALTESALTFQIAANTTSEVRIGEIEIKDKNSSLADTIRISQGTSDTYTGDVVLSTVEEVKAFAEMGYKKIDGSLIVEGNELTTLTQLNNQLEEIRDSLIINGTGLTNLDGLYGLKKVGGNVNIKDMSTSNPVLEGLNNLETIGGNLEIHARNLTSIKGLSKLQSIGGSFRVYDGSFTSFEGLENLTHLPGNLEIIYCNLHSLESFKGLNGLQSIGGSFKINTQTGGLNSLTSFGGLESLENISGNFEISTDTRGLYNLTSFKGLENLVNIGGNFEINANFEGLGALASFEGLENLASIGGNFKIKANFKGLRILASFKGLENLTSIGGNFEIKANGTGALHKLASFEGLRSLISIDGNFEISAEASMYESSLDILASFKGLENLSSIGGNFKIEGRIGNSFALNGLSSFEGLENLTSINGDFTSNQYIRVENNLSNLTTVGGNMKIWIITEISSNTFDANFSRLESVGGSLSLVSRNSSSGTLSLPLLQAIGGECSFDEFDLIDFPNLESINGTLEISNVNSIGTLDKLKSVGDITIRNCSSLYDFCNWVPVLTDYNGTFLVTGCGYNPTKYQILNGECSQTPAN